MFNYPKSFILLYMDMSVIMSSCRALLTLYMDMSVPITSCRACWHCVWTCLSPLHLAELADIVYGYVCHHYILQGLADIVYGRVCHHYILQGLADIVYGHVCPHYILQGFADIVYGHVCPHYILQGLLTLCMDMSVPITSCRACWHCIWICLSSLHLAGPCWHCIWTMSVIIASCRALLTLYMDYVYHHYILQGLADIVYGLCLSSLHLAGPSWHCIWPMSIIIASCRAFLTLYMAYVYHHCILQGLADIVYGLCLSSLHLAGPCWHCIWPLSIIIASCRALLTLYMAYVYHHCIVQGLADIVYGLCLSSLHLAGPSCHCIWPMSIIIASCRALLTLYMDMSVINTSCRALLTLYMDMSVINTSCRALLTLYMAYVYHHCIVQGLADIVYGLCLSSLHLAGPCWHCIWPMSVINTSCRAFLTLYMAYVYHHCILQGLADIVYGLCLSSLHLAGPSWHCIWPMSVINTSCRALLTLYMAYVYHHCILQGLADIVYGLCLSSLHLAGPCWHCIWPMSIIIASCRALLTLYMAMSIIITSCRALLTLYMAHVCHQYILQGLADIVYGHQPSFSLVSNGAEIIKINKKLYVDNADQRVMTRNREEVRKNTDKHTCGRGVMKLHLQWQPSGETLIIFTNLYSDGFLLKPLFLSK